MFCLKKYVKPAAIPIDIINNKSVAFIEFDRQGLVIAIYGKPLWFWAE